MRLYTEHRYWQWGEKTENRKLRVAPMSNDNHVFNWDQFWWGFREQWKDQLKGKLHLSGPVSGLYCFFFFQFLQGTTLQYYVTYTVVYPRVPRLCPPMLPKPSLDMSSRHNLSHTLYYLWSIHFLLFSSIRFVSFSNGAYVHENLRLIAVTYISSMKNETEVIIYWNQAYL